MTQQNPLAGQKIILFGGNGFVGAETARQLTEKGADVLSVSRTGAMPAHLHNANQNWPRHVNWLRGDATNPDQQLLDGASAIVALVGSPPLPTFSKRAYQQQLFNNSIPNCRAIEAAARAGVKRVVLLAAHIPSFLQRESFGYYQGKQCSINAARAFADESSESSAIVLMPSGIYGKRYTASGKAIPLDSFMRPIAALQQAMPKVIRAYLPETLVSVSAVAGAAVKAIESEQYSKGFAVISNQQIVYGSY